MGLLDLFKKKDQENTSETIPGPEVKKESSAPEPLKSELLQEEIKEEVQPQKENTNLPNANADKTEAIIQLLAVPHEQRNQEWGDAFLLNLAGASFKCGNPQVIAGPDGFPYVQLLTPITGESDQLFTIEKMTEDFLLQQGLGVVINPENAQPDWVLTYGNIVNLHVNQSFYTHKSSFSNERRDETIQEQEEVLIAQPSEEILPLATRSIISHYLKMNGVTSPKVLLMMRHTGNKEEVMQDLAFNPTPKDFETEEQFRDVMQSLGWFLPSHYSYVGMDEQTFENGFAPL